MGTVLAVLGVLAVLFVAALVATRDGELLVDAPRDAADPDLPADGPVRADDLERVRFGMALRGYRMAEVDALLDRLAAELRERDERISALSTDAPDRGDGDDGGGETALPPVHERPGAQPPRPVPFPEPVHVDRPERLPDAPDERAPDGPGDEPAAHERAADEQAAARRG